MWEIARTRKRVRVAIEIAEAAGRKYSLALRRYSNAIDSELLILTSPVDRQ